MARWSSHNLVTPCPLPVGRSLKRNRTMIMWGLLSSDVGQSNRTMLMWGLLSSDVGQSNRTMLLWGLLSSDVGQSNRTMIMWGLLSSDVGQSNRTMIMWGLLSSDVGQSNQTDRVQKVSRFGPAITVGLVNIRTLVRFHLGSPLSSKVVVCGHCLVTHSQ